ncbi:Disease resistance protein (CC-NBS-LRR) [Rhynchospora pubera]|uniref:Disease resistance protein (CC-NBS-LRR) n=2 Tax=Rhynchospora pubera TaxID=906938 RepID=A0AAV8EHZ8_9POAL|nr:Disease resistance protein (CC-NBS-LRR) [Rhynchospora pubera]
MAADEVGMLLGIPGEMEKLIETVRDIQCVLSDAEQKQTSSSAIKRWLLQLKDVMYDADDLMDICRIKAEDRHGRYDFLSSSKVSCGIRFLSCFHNPLFAHKIGKRIKDLNSSMDEISKKKSDLGLVELQDVVRPFNTSHEYSDISRQTDPSVALADLVGGKIEEDTDLLVKWLTLEEMSGKENVSAVAIVGMPGIGKTTLAKRVFNDPRIQEVFHLKFWVCVSKDLKGVELLKCIIREAGGNHGAAEERSELVSMLERLVRGKKFILVLDDVWPGSQNVWDDLLRVPMNGGAHGSRLLVTTRDDRVVRFMHAKASHQVEKLLEKDGWCLLIKQVALDETESEILKDIGLELVKKCDGVPLAIKAIGGVLRMKGKNRADWKKIIKSTLWSLADLSSDFPHAFYLSYEDLPSHLKQCFVLCSLYPEDTVFERSELVYLWLAEGFLCDDGALSFLELGIEYYKELIVRNLLEVSGGYYDQICCKMHDLWRSFAGYLGNGDNFIMREGELPSRSEPLLKLRRLSIEGTVVDLDFLNKEKYLRTLLLVYNSMGEFLSNALVSFSHLRIVDLYKSNISSLPDSFCGLVHLRYLDLTGSLLIALPNSIGKLRNLVFLGLGGCLWLSDFPSSIVNLLELRFLSFHNTTIEVFPVGLRKLEKLVELHGFKPDTNNSKGLSSLEDIGNLSQLSKLILCSLEKASDITVAKEAKLKEKGQLKTLILSYTPNQGREDPTTFEEKKVAQDVLNALSPPPSLEILQIIGYFGLQLPNWLHVGINLSNFQFLRFLELTECECISQLPPVGQLPNLDLLRIKRCNISYKYRTRIFIG